MKRKFCIFCGENPIDKNKEHIIPKWLIQMTDKPNRKTVIGSNYKGEKLTIPWNKFVFPSCEICNTNFGKLEAKVKNIVTNLLNEKPLSHGQMDLFLDWLDKIRTGLWLGQLIHKKIDLDPHFYINQRVGEKDRTCLIYKIDDKEKGINITGTDLPIFHLIPSCFSLTINHLCFFSYSKEFILSENLGFPFPSEYTILEDGRMAIEKFKIGNSKVANRILNGTILQPSIRLYQSILTGEHQINRPRIGRGAKFYKNNCFTFIKNKIKSRIYIINDYNGNCMFWPLKKGVLFSGQQQINRELLENFVAKMVLEHQIQSAKHHFNKSTKELNDGLGELIKINESNLKKIDDLLIQVVPEYYR
ncbi:MAG: hypothetical protein ACI93N_001035 [Flavobacteriaceae bacterium]|jgi:hypothetical protein